MTKLQFLIALHDQLKGLPQDDVEERLNFYAEMIEDHMEDGLPEEEAVAAVGLVEEIVEQIISEIPITKIVKEKLKPKRRYRAWEIVLIAVGSPIWFSLLVAAFSVVLSLYVSAWAVIISLWSAFVSVAIGGVLGLVLGVIFCLGTSKSAGFALIAAAVCLMGLSILFFLGCKIITKYTLVLTKKILVFMKRKCTRKENARCVNEA